MYSQFDVTIVISNWMQQRMTLGAIKNLKEYYPDVPMIVLDNGSIDNDKQYFDRLYLDTVDLRYDPGIDKLSLENGWEFKQIPENVGHGAIFDIGISMVKTPLALFVDNDVRIRRNILSELLEIFNKNPKLYAAGPAYPSNTLRKKWVGLQLSLFKVDPIINNRSSFNNVVFSFGRRTYHLEPGFVVQQILCTNYPDRTRKIVYTNKIMPEIDKIDGVMHLRTRKDIEAWIDG